MLYRALILVLFLSGFFFITSCDTGVQGDLNENQPPLVFLSVESVDRSENRLSSQVHIRWWGSDPDGYVVGYEFAIDDPSGWTFTTRTDSVFVLPIEPGEQTGDVEFFVRAIDNEGLASAEPASVVFQIVNTPPVATFDRNVSVSDTTYNIANFGWSISDADGEENLRDIEIALNDTTAADAWKVLPIGVNFINLVLENGDTNPQFRVHTGQTFQATDVLLDNVQLDSDNTFYLRAVDQADARSEVDEITWHLKRQTSRILFLNDYSTNTEAAATLHQNLLANAGITEYDYIDISDGVVAGGFKVPFTQAFPSVTTPTVNQTLAYWDYIYWVSNDLDRNIVYALEITEQFFENGGKMFLNIPSKFLTPDEGVFNFLPVTRMTPRPTEANNFIVVRNEPVLPVGGFSGPELQLASNLQNRPPIQVAPGAQPLYQATFRLSLLTGGSAPFDGNSIVAARSADDNMIYFALDMRDFENNQNLADFLAQMVLDELGFSSN